MRIFKGFVPMALSVSLVGFSGCGSVDHDPPKLKNVFGTISPMDTLVAVFDKDIDDFDESQVTSNVPISVVKQKGSKIYVIGASDTVAGIPRFEAASDADTLTFNALKDDDGNKAKSQSATFSTFPFLDHDEYESDANEDCFSNGKPIHAEVLTDSASSEFFNGVKTRKGITVSGVLAGIYNKNCKDDEDIFRVFLKKRDTISVQLSGRSKSVPLELGVLGPSKMKNAPDYCKYENDEFLTVDESGLKKGASIDTTFGIGDIHECGTNTVTDYLAYYIVVRYSGSLATNEKEPQPYKLTVTIQERN